MYRLRSLRRLVRKLCLRLEGGPMFSTTWRTILREAHGVEVGQYSYGSILNPGLLPEGTRVGSYCSVGGDLIVRRRNHPTDRPVLHPFFYESALGFLTGDTIPLGTSNPLHMGHDVWIGARVTILSGCRFIGNGAVIAAGAVVTRDVAPYTIVGGVPARSLRTRFDAERVAQIEASRWWDRDLADLIADPPFGDMLGSIDRKGRA